MEEPSFRLLKRDFLELNHFLDIYCLLKYPLPLNEHLQAGAEEKIMKGTAWFSCFPIEALAMLPLVTNMHGESSQGGKQN